MIPFHLCSSEVFKARNIAVSSCFIFIRIYLNALYLFVCNYFATANNMKVIADVQGFMIGKKKFSPKELAIYDGARVTHVLFQPPFQFSLLPKEFQKQANWLMDNHHSIDWNIGFTPEFMFPEILRSATAGADVVYVKGREKAEYLQALLEISVEEYKEQPHLPKLSPSCFYHSKSPSVCALSNVYYLYNFFSK